MREGMGAVLRVGERGYDRMALWIEVGLEGTRESYCFLWPVEWYHVRRGLGAGAGLQPAPRARIRTRAREEVRTRTKQ